MTENKLDELLEKIKGSLIDLYGEHLKGVYLFGSYARGDQDKESDLDILIVLDKIDHYGIEIERTGYFASQLSLEYGVSISRKFISEKQWLAENNALLRNVRAEAIPA